MDGVLHVTLIALLTYSLIGEVPAEIQILDPADFLDPLTDQLVMGYSNILLPIAGIRRTKTLTIKENTGNKKPSVKTIRDIFVFSAKDSMLSRDFKNKVLTERNYKILSTLNLKIRQIK